MENITLYRRRLIPDEIVHLKDDIVLYHDDTVIITKWKTIKPRKDMDHGFSAYLLKEGIKVSKFYRADHSLLYWYCDIVDYEYDSATNSYTSTDLLADVVLYPDGKIKVLDLDELAEASVKDIISKNQLHSALIRTDKLLNVMYRNEFEKYANLINKYDT